MFKSRLLRILQTGLDSEGQGITPITHDEGWSMAAYRVAGQQWPSKFRWHGFPKRLISRGQGPLGTKRGKTVS
jgi:hypothetical protein